MKEKAFLPEDTVNVPIDEEDPTKCWNVGTGSAWKCIEIKRVLDKELENIMWPQQW